MQGQSRAVMWLLCVSVAAAPVATRAQDRPVYEPAPLLAAPPDGSAYWDRSQEAVQLARNGKLEEAERAYEELTRAYPIRGAPWVELGSVKARLGKYRQAADAYRIAADLIGPLGFGQPRYFQAVNLVAAGDLDAALDALDDFVFEGRTPRRPNLYDNPAFAPLRSHPRFLRLAGRDESAAQLPRDAGWRRDIQHLLAEMKRIEPRFHDQPITPAILRQAEQLSGSVPTLSDEQIYVGIERIISSLGHGHSGLFPFVPSRRAFTQLPVQFWAFPEGIHIVNASGEAASLIGARLISIEGTPGFDALRQVGSVQSNESGPQVLWTGAYHLGVAQMLKGLGIARDADSIELELRLPDGQTVRRALQTIPLERRPKLVPPPHVPAPLFLQRVPQAHWFQELRADDAMYVQVNQVTPSREETLPQFGVRLRQALAASTAHNLILDLRHNNGGDTSTYPELVRTIVSFTAQSGKHLYVIIGRDTYSAAANLIADLERFADPIFVGEPSSMSGNNAGDESHFVLPYSGIRGAFSSVRWQLSHPWDTRRSIVPQIPVPLTAKAYFRGEDPALETILRRINRTASPGGS